MFTEHALILKGQEHEMVFWPIQSLLGRKESTQSFLKLTEPGHDLAHLAL
jgi:hypothetical protein